MKRLFYMLLLLLFTVGFISVEIPLAQEVPCDDVIIPDCSECHPGIDFTVPTFVDRETVCYRCHNNVLYADGSCYHGCTSTNTLMHADIATIHGEGDPMPYPPEYGVGEVEIHTGVGFSSTCARCHAGMASCKTCHADVPHEIHGSSQFPPGMVNVSTGTAFIENAQLSCTIVECHGTLGSASFVRRPDCGNCHGPGGGTGSAHQIAKHSTFDCLECHVNAQMTLDQSIHGVDRANTLCEDCHGPDFFNLFSPDDPALVLDLTDGLCAKNCHDGKTNMGGSDNKGCLPCHFETAECSWDGRWNGFMGSRSWGHNFQKRNNEDKTVSKPKGGGKK